MVKLGQSKNPRTDTGVRSVNVQKRNVSPKKSNTKNSMKKNSAGSKRRGVY